MERFQKYWYDVHGEIECRMKNLRKYEQNLVISPKELGSLPRVAVDFCGYSELWFDSIHDMNEGIASLNGADYVNRPLFTKQKSKVLILAKKSNKIIPNYLKKRKLIKAVSFLGYQENISAEQFKYEWWYGQSILTKTMCGCVGCNLNLVIDRFIDGQSVPYEELPIAGVAEFWFEDSDVLHNACTGKEFNRIYEHSKLFIGKETTYIVETYPVPCLHNKDYKWQTDIG